MPCNVVHAEKNCNLSFFISLFTAENYKSSFETIFIYNNDEIFSDGYLAATETFNNDI